MAPEVHPGVNYIVRGDGRRVRIQNKSRLIQAGFRCHNPECGVDQAGVYQGKAFHLHSVLPAPNFLPGLVVRTIRAVDSGGETGHISDDTYVVDDEATLRNLRGEDEYGHPLGADQKQAVLHHRWMHELAHADNPDPEDFPEHLDIRCPHCGSPEDEYDMPTARGRPTFNH